MPLTEIDIVATCGDISYSFTRSWYAKGTYDAFGNPIAQEGIESFSTSGAGDLTDAVTSHFTNIDYSQGYGHDHYWWSGVNLPMEAGKYFSITIPDFNPAWGDLEAVGCVISGEDACSFVSTGVQNCTPQPKAARSIYTIPNGGEIGPGLSVSPQTGITSTWEVHEPWLMVLSGDYAYQKVSSGDGGNLPASAHFKGPTDVPSLYFDPPYNVEGHSLGPTNIVQWFNANKNSTKSLRMAVIHGANFSYSYAAAIPRPGTIVYSDTTTVTSSATNLKVWFRLRFRSNTQTQAAPLIADSFNNITVACGLGAPSGTRQQLVVHWNRGINLNAGSGNGTVAGWTSYGLRDVDAGSPVGLVFLPNGHLYISFMDAGSAKYIVSKRFGVEGSWSNPAALTNGAAGILAGGRGTQQVWAYRVV